MKNSKLNLTAFAAVLVLVGSLGLIACNRGGGDGGGGGGTVGPVTSSGYCNGCLLSGVQAMTPDGTVAFLLSVNGNSGFSTSDPKAVVYYNGAATFTGIMHVSASSPTWCGMPVGDYAVQSATASNFGWLMMMGGVVDATGPINVRFRISNAIFYNTDGGGVSSASPNNRVNLSLILDSVGGYPCGMMSTY